MKSKHNSDEDLSGSGLYVVSDQHAYREGATDFLVSCRCWRYSVV